MYSKQTYPIFFFFNYDTRAKKNKKALSPRPIHIELLQKGIAWEWLQDDGKRFRTQNLIDIYHEALGTTMLTPWSYNFHNS